MTVDEVERDLPRVFDAMDQPTVDGLNTWLVSKAAASLTVDGRRTGDVGPLVPIGDDEIKALEEMLQLT